jgi:hypothetical protein
MKPPGQTLQAKTFIPKPFKFNRIWAAWECHPVRVCGCVDDLGQFRTKGFARLPIRARPAKMRPPSGAPRIALPAVQNRITVTTYRCFDISGSTQVDGPLK